MADLTKTIAAKADQMNADDLIGGPMTVTITRVDQVANDQQPILIHVKEWKQPYKPCKTMRRLLCDVWGGDGNNYIGKMMTLFRNPEVMYSGVKVGGIEISHMSGITKPHEVMLTVTRGKKKLYRVEPLSTAITQPQIVAMKTAWFNAVKAAGLPATKPDFEQFVTEATGGRVAASNVLVADKYSQADLQACSDAVARIGMKPDATDLTQQNDIYSAFGQEIAAGPNRTQGADILQRMTTSRDGGELTAEQYQELSERLGREME